MNVRQLIDHLECLASTGYEYAEIRMNVAGASREITGTTTQEDLIEEDKTVELTCV